jgi:hypothetical protein
LKSIVLFSCADRYFFFILFIGTKIENLFTDL